MRLVWMSALAVVGLGGCAGPGQAGGTDAGHVGPGDLGGEATYVFRDEAGDDRHQLDPGEWNVTIRKKGVATATKADVYAWCGADGKVHEVVCSTGAYCEVDGDLTTEECTWEATRRVVSDVPRTCAEVCGGRACNQPQGNLKSCTPKPAPEAPLDVASAPDAELGGDAEILQLDPGEWNFEVLDTHTAPSRKGLVTVHSFCSSGTTREIACHEDVLCPPGTTCTWTPIAGKADAKHPPVNCQDKNPCGPRKCAPVAGTKPCSMP